MSESSDVTDRALAAADTLAAMIDQHPLHDHLCQVRRERDAEGGLEERCYCGAVEVLAALAAYRRARGEVLAPVSPTRGSPLWVEEERS